MKEKEVYQKLIDHGVRPSVQRMAILKFLLTHFTHPTVDDVFSALRGKIPSLSRTTVYNTLRLLSDHHVAQMINIDDHHVCYDGITTPHVHFMCKKCGKLYDLFDEQMPKVDKEALKREGFDIDDVQLYYKGICPKCSKENPVN